MKKTLVTVAFALLTMAGCLSAASAGDKTPPTLPGHHPPPPTDCFNAILVFDPDIGEYWLCLDPPRH